VVTTHFFCCKTSYLFYLFLETTPFIPKGYVAKERKPAAGPRSDCSNKRDPALHGANLGAGVLPYKRDEKKTIGEAF